MFGREHEKPTTYSAVRSCNARIVRYHRIAVKEGIQICAGTDR